MVVVHPIRIISSSPAIYSVYLEVRCGDERRQCPCLVPRNQTNYCDHFPHILAYLLACRFMCMCVCVGEFNIIIIIATTVIINERSPLQPSPTHSPYIHHIYADVVPDDSFLYSRHSSLCLSSPFILTHPFLPCSSNPHSYLLSTWNQLVFVYHPCSLSIYSTKSIVLFFYCSQPCRSLEDHRHERISRVHGNSLRRA